MYERFIFVPRNPDNSNPLAVSFYGMPQFLADAVEQIVKDYKNTEVKTKQLWSAVDKPLTIGLVTSEMCNKVKDQYGTGIVIETKDTGRGRSFIVLKTDVNKRLMLGTLLDENQSMKPAVVSGNDGGQSIIERRGGNGKEFVLDGLGQTIPRYVYRCLNNQDVVNLTNPKVFAILAKFPGAGNSMLEHVGGQKQTKYISTTRAKHEIQNPHGETFDGGAKVKIDLSFVASNKIFDLSTELGAVDLRKAMGQGEPSGINLQALKDVKRTKEVLIEKSIPGEAIVATRGFTIPDVIQIGNNADF